MLHYGVQVLRHFCPRTVVVNRKRKRRKIRKRKMNRRKRKRRKRQKMMKEREMKRTEYLSCTLEPS